MEDRLPGVRDSGWCVGMVAGGGGWGYKQDAEGPGAEGTVQYLH